jgi:hypothetical protein
MEGEKEICALTSEWTLMNQISSHLIFINRNVGEVGDLGCNLVGIIFAFAI